MRKTGISIAAVLLILFFSSCSSRGEVFLSSEGAGKAKVSITLSPMAVRYAEDIAGGFSPNQRKEDFKIFDESKLQSRLDAMEGVKFLSSESSSAGRLDFAFSFDHIERIFPSRELSGGDLVSFSEKGGLKTLDFNLNKDNFSAITGFLGLGNNEIIDTFGPQAGEPYTGEEYLEMVEFLFDEYASKEAVDGAVKTASIRFIVSVEGKNLHVTADSPVTAAVKGSEAEIEIPLLAVLTLSNPVTFRIIWE